MQTEAIIIRQAYPDDANALGRLAQLDAKSLGAESYLVAEVDGRLVAARGLDTGVIAADPFIPTAGIVALLEVHARRLETTERPGQSRLQRFASVASRGMVGGAHPAR